MQIYGIFRIHLNRSSKEKHDAIFWEITKSYSKKWCQGKTTGYPFVDAGMRELNKTGHMHNRVRRIVASFYANIFNRLALGEASIFAQNLLDYEMASNVGNCNGL